MFRRPGRYLRRRYRPESTSTTSIEARYQRKSPRDHVLLRPEVYVGPFAMQDRSLWVWNDGRIVYDTIRYIPALYKLFDEILVNAADNRCRDSETAHPMTYIDVRIDPEAGVISVENDGQSLPVIMHSTEKMYVPELLFGNLLTSSNYDDDVVRYTGGRHGYGAKLANIFSNEFIVELRDGDRDLEFRQRYTDNMGRTWSPEITERRRRLPDESHSWTRITFRPDLARFKLDRLDHDLLALMQRRVLDMAVCHPDLTVRLNGVPLRCPTLAEYVGRHDGLDPAQFTVLDLPGRWRIALGPSTTARFQHGTFVNNVATLDGGTHVDLVLGQVRGAVLDVLARPPYRTQALAPHRVRDCLHLLMIGHVPNPEFESQSKERLTTNPLSFKDDLTLSRSDIQSIVTNSSIIDCLLEASVQTQGRNLKKTDGRKRRQVLVPKLDDANWAGGKRSAECCLIITEGDSAKALAVSGLSVLGRDRFGVYPLRGKILNVRDATSAKLLKNQEFLAIKQILGLQTGRRYNSVADLRYGQVMLMADQDHDGSHIKGLFINILHHFWPQLLRIPGFLTQFVTPIVRARRGSSTVQFFTLPEYQAWRQQHPDWRAKYYKGLGTSTSAEAKEYFSDLARHRVTFEMGSSEEIDDDLIDLCFNSERANDRKLWLQQITPNTHIDYSTGRVSLSDFINKELILYSMADNIRSIPALADGLKPGQRKILYACFKRGLVDEIKVAQLAGYVAEHTAYHHGEVALCQSIVRLAQDYVGSNNVNVLAPNGQFGTRHAGGKDAASARYIFTCLSPSARALFPSADDDLLSYAYDDEMRIEPHWFVPIIPMAIVNGSQGIGTGWLSSIPNHDPRLIIQLLRDRIQGQHASHTDLIPAYRGFQGRIVPNTTDSEGHITSYQCTGCHHIEGSDQVEITELPIGRTTESYKQFLDDLITAGRLSSYTAHHTDHRVHFVLKLAAPLQNLSNEALVRALRLTSSISLTNMVLFDLNGALHRYNNVNEIINEFFDLRLDFYRQRKQHLEQRAAHDLDLIRNRAEFVDAILTIDFQVHNRSRAELIDELDRRRYRLHNGSYDYLLSMPIWALTQERVRDLRADLDRAQTRLEDLRRQTPQDMWLRDLDQLQAVLDRDQVVCQTAGDSPAPRRIKRRKCK